MSLKINKHYLLILAVICIFILIPCSFAEELNENQTMDVLNLDDSTSDAIVTADNNVIYVDSSTVDGDGSQENPYNLSKAVSTYDSNVNSKIIMKNGEYTFTEQLNLNKDIVIEGESYNNVILNGNGETSILKASKGNIVITNLKFINGYSEYGFSDNHASGLQITSVNHILVDNCIFENNANGALSASGSKSVVDVQNSIFDSNFVEYDWSGRGAAISAGASDLELNVVNTTFKNNYINASITQGGAIYGHTNFESFVFDNCIFMNNTAETGSAIYSYCGGNITVLDTQFINQTPSVIYDNQINSRYLNLFIKNLTFDSEDDGNIVVAGKVHLVSLENNDKLSGTNINRMDEGDDENYTVTLTDSDDNPIEGKEIIVTLTDYYNQVTTLNATTNANGQVTFSMRNQTPGKYKVLAYFKGDDKFDYVETTNVINIRSEEIVNLKMIPDSIKIKEGESYIVTGYIVDAYYEPTSQLSGSMVVVEWYNPTKHSLTAAAQIEGSSFTFDIAQCSLKTSDELYEVTFNVDPGIYEGYVSLIQAVVTVDLSVDLPDVGDIDVIYVSTNGSDETGNGSEDNPVATVQLALNINKALGGGKTIIVDEGTYDISNFNILSDVTIIGESKTIFRQTSGRNGMFKIFDPITVNFVNLTFIDGYTTPTPYSLITAYGEGVVVNIEGCEFRNNTCLNGATIAVSHDASVYVNNSLFIDNKCILIQSTGGAIYVIDGYLKVSNSQFINNTACDGGAIWIGYPGTADIINSTFVDNIAYNTTVVLGGGGAIYTKGVTTIKNSTFIDNYADLYGGAVYVAGGETTITKSYFENNTVGTYPEGTIKGSAIQSEPWTTFEFTLEYSILLTNDGRNYVALFSNNEKADINVNYNYWGSNTWNRMNTNVDVSDYVIIQPRTDTDPVYKDAETTIDIEFKDYNIYDKSIRDLDGFVHDYTVDVSSSLNSINSTIVTIIDNVAYDEYYPTSSGKETIIAKDTSLTFDVIDSNKKDINANITITSGNTTTITVQVPSDLTNNVTIIVKDTEYSRSVGNGTITLELDTLPGNYKVIVKYSEDDVYRGFSKTDYFNVPKYPSKMNVTVEDIVEEQSAYVDITITDGATGNLVIILNGNYRYPAVIEEKGKAFKIIYDLPIGNYTVDVIYEGDSLYEGCNASTTFEVSERPEIIEPVEPLDGYAYIFVQTGSETTITVHVPANLTNNVTITIGGDVYSRESGDGVITLTIPTETEGLYSVNVNYAGDENYNPFSASKIFRIYDYCWFINETGYRTLREAVDAAGDGDVIKGNISLYETDETVDVGHRYMPSEPWELVKNITITSMGDDPVTIKGNAHRLFYIDRDSHLTLSNLILTGSDVGVLDGGAVENTYDAYVTIVNCTFTNFTADRGGALFLWGQAVVKDSIFIDNQATLGGAIFILSPVTNSNNVILDNITLINNSAVSYGGALYISGSFANVTVINNSNFTNNLGHGKGGAIYATYGNVIIDNSVFDSNKAVDYDFENEVELSGGAVYISNYVMANISNTQFMNNYADEYAGALACDNSKTGVLDLQTGDESWTIYYTNIDNCTFENNTAGISGGAIYIGFIAVPTINITDSVFYSNKAPDAAAISNDYGELLIKGTEFKNNVASNSSTITTYGVYTDDKYDAITTIVNSKFTDNDVASEINQLNTYTILTIENTTFNTDAVILVNNGEATLTNVVQSRDNGDYAIVNNNSLSLSNNTFTNPIINNGKILTQTYVVVLDNETKSAELNSIYNLKAIVCDDNGNIIEKGNLVFVIGEDKISAVYENQQFNADFSVGVGSYIVGAQYDDAGLVNLVVKTGEIVGKKSTEMLIGMDDIKVGENATIAINVPSQATGNITVKINNKTYEVEIKNGEAKFTISDLKAGQYPVEITYSGNEVFAPKTQEANLTVSKIDDYDFVVDAKDITTNSATIDITLPDDVNGDVTLVIDGKNQSIVVKDGKASIPLSELTVGQHDVEVMFDGNDKYDNSTAKTSFSVSKLNSFVKVTAEDVVVGNDVIIKLVVPDDADGDIIVTVGGKDYLVSVAEGKANAVISDLNIGEYSVEVTYTGDLNYLDSTNKTSFKVINKEESNATSAKNTLIELTIDNINVSGILREVNGNPIAGAVISYIIDGGNSGNVTTGANGEFAIEGVEGKKITFQFLGNETTSGTVAVVCLKNVTGAGEPVIKTKKDTVIVVDPAFTRVANDYYAGERGAFFYAVLKDSEGNVLVNKTVSIAVNGPIYNVTTDDQGRAGLQVNFMNANIYTYALAFAGDDEYNAAQLASSKLTITKKSTSITATAKSYKVKATKKYTVTLKTAKNPYNGKTYLKSGKKLTLKVKGKTYTAKINSKGKATFTLKLTKKGKFTAKIKFAGDKTYKASSKSVKITVK